MTDDLPIWAWLITAKHAGEDDPRNWATHARTRAEALGHVYDHAPVEWCATPEVVRRVA